MDWEAWRLGRCSRRCRGREGEGQGAFSQQRWAGARLCTGRRRVRVWLRILAARWQRGRGREMRWVRLCMCWWCWGRGRQGQWRALDESHCGRGGGCGFQNRCADCVVCVRLRLGQGRCGTPAVLACVATYAWAWHQHLAKACCCVVARLQAVWTFRVRVVVVVWNDVRRCSPRWAAVVARAGGVVP